MDYVEYPHEITQRANAVDNISKWVYEPYNNQSYGYDRESKKTI